MHHIFDQISLAADILQSLVSDEKVQIVKEIFVYVHLLVVRKNDVPAELDSKNATLFEEASLVTPHQLVFMRTGVFIGDFLDPCRDWLSQY